MFTLEEMKKAVVHERLITYRGNMTSVAHSLDVTLKTIYNWMHSWNMKPSQYRDRVIGYKPKGEFTVEIKRKENRDEADRVSIQQDQATSQAVCERQHQSMAETRRLECAEEKDQERGPVIPELLGGISNDLS